MNISKRFTLTRATYELVFETDSGDFNSEKVTLDFPKKLSKKQLMRHIDKVKKDNTLVVRLDSIDYLKAVASIPYEVASQYVREVTSNG